MKTNKSNKNTVVRTVANRVERGRIENINNEAYIVYPVVMIVEGVLNGTLYTNDELANFSQTWNGVPVTIQHPESQGMSVSANSPEIFNTQVVGTVFNTHYENGKLKAEIWLRNTLLEQLEPSLKAKLLSGEKLEVSTGLFCEDLQSEGKFNGVEYSSIAHNIRPDHLALLPGGVGACSWEDGCGVRSNEKEGKMIKTKKVNKIDKEWDEFFVNTGEFVVNEVEYTQLLEIMSNKIDSMDIGGEKINYLKRMYPNYVIYSVHVVGSNEQSKMYKRNYTITDNKIEWTSDPVEVTMTETFSEVQTNNKLKPNEEEIMAKKMKECCPDKVNELIENNENFTEDDRDTLLEMTEDAFALTINVAKPVEKKETEEIVDNEEEEEERVISSFDELYANASPELKEAVEYGKKLVENKKAELIKTIKENKSNKFSDKELNGFEIEFLEKLSGMTPKANYSANSGTTTVVDNDEIEPLPNPHTVDEK